MPAPTEDDLIAGIRAAPDEDAPRLVFADWLEEHGHDARAQLVRVQLAFARAPGDFSLRQQQSFAIRAAAPLWDARVGSGRIRMYFTRGLPETVSLRGSDLDLCDALARNTLVRGLYTTAFSDADLARVLGHDAAAFVDALHHDRGETAVAVLRTWPRLGALHTLELNGCRLTGDEVASLLDRSALAPRVLNLMDNRIGDDGAGALAACPRLSSLEELHLQYNGLTRAGVDALVASPYLRPRLRLVIDGAPLGLTYHEPQFGGQDWWEGDIPPEVTARFALEIP